MWPLFGLVLLGADPSGAAADEKPQPAITVEVRLVEFEPIEGVTKHYPWSEDHLHIKPLLVVTPADVASIKRRTLRGPTFGTKETGFRHQPRHVVDVTLTKEAKLRLKKAVEERTTTGKEVITTVVNDRHDGAWTKYVTNDPSAPNHWSHFGPRISCWFHEKNVDEVVEYLTPSK